MMKLSAEAADTVTLINRNTDINHPESSGTNTFEFGKNQVYEIDQDLITVLGKIKIKALVGDKSYECMFYRPLGNNLDDPDFLTTVKKVFWNKGKKDNIETKLNSIKLEIII